MMFLSLISLVFAEIPANSTIESAALIDIPPEGFSSISELLPALIPEFIPVSPTSDGGEGLGCEYTYGLDNLWIDIDVDNALITPQDGYLSMDVDLLVSVNNLSDRFILDFAVSSCGFFNSASTCYGYVTPFPATAQARIDFVLTDSDGDGIQELDATISDLTLDYSSVNANNFEIECLVGSILDALNWIGVDVYSFVLDLVGPILEAELQQELPNLEATIEEAFANATINEDIPIADNIMKLMISPEDLLITPEGFRLSFDGKTAVETTAECVATYDSGSSLETSGTPNNIGDLAVPADVGIAIRDEFINQALYSVWRTGTICQTIDQDVFALDTSILNLLTGDSFTTLFEDTKPMVIKIDPVLPPTVDMSVDSDVGISIEDLRLNFFTEVDEREVQVLSVSLKTIAGLDLLFDPNTGALEGDIALDPDEIDTRIVANEFKPENAQIIIDNFGSQIGSLLDLVGLDSLLSSLNFQLPSVNGVGVEQVEITGTGSESSDLGSHLSIGPVPYSGGCSSDGSAGCSISNHAQQKGKGFFIIMVGVLGYLRRRAR